MSKFVAKLYADLFAHLYNLITDFRVFNYFYNYLIIYFSCNL